MIIMALLHNKAAEIQPSTLLLLYTPCLIKSDHMAVDTSDMLVFFVSHTHTFYFLEMYPDLLLS